MLAVSSEQKIPGLTGKCSYNNQAAMDLGLTLRQIGYRVKQFGLEKLIKEHRGQMRSL
jgi:hypothetical protein